MSVSFSWSRAGDAAANAPPKPQVDAKQTVPVTDQLQRVHDAWNPQSPNCAFQHYFYNRVPPEQAQQYVMPPGQDPQKWERAMMARPDPASVPVLAVGFTDLEKRVNLQNQQVNAYRVRMHEINDKLVELSNRHDLHTTVKLLEMRERHSKLARRALALAIRIQVLSNRGHVLTPQEELFQKKVKNLIQRADDPAVFGSLNEAWARIKALKSRSQLNGDAEGASATGTARNDTNNESTALALDWDSDREQLELIVKVLHAQQKGITFLAQLIEDDTQRLNEELGLVPKKPKQKAMPAMAVAPQAFAANIPASAPPPQQQQQQQQQPQQTQQPTQTQQQQPQAQTQQGLFSKPAAGLFGSSQPSNQQSGGLFGSKPAGTGLFSQQNAQPPPPAPSGGLFGSKPGGLFGQSQTQPAQSQTGGLFGNNSQSGGFGSTQSQSSQPSGGLFGSTQNQSSQPSGGLFGSNQQQQSQPSGGLFGSTQNQQNQPASGGLFGNTQQNQQNQPASGGLFGNTQQNQQNQPASGGLFGNTQQQNQPASGGLFGNTQQNQQNQPASGGLFGNTQQQNQPASGGLFGNTQQQHQQSQPSGGLFGNTQQQQNQPSGGLFGNTQNQPASGGLFSFGK